MEEQERKLYEKKQRARLEEWEAELEKMKAKVSKAGADAQLNLKRRLEQLEDRVDEGRSRLEELTDSGESKWEALQERIDTALEAVKVGVREARKELDSDG